MNRLSAWIWPFCALLIVFSTLLADRARAQNDNYQDEDPPSRVARMSYRQGSVSFQPGGEGDWVDAVPNRPLTTGDNLWTDRDSRAEMHVGSTSIRLSGETSLTFLELDDRVLQLRLAQGSVMVRVRHFDDDDTVEIDTPNLAFMVRRTGEYRVEVDPDGRTTIVNVYSGRGDAVGGGNNYTVVARQSARFAGDPDQGLDYEINSLRRPDDFERWAFDRDRHEDDSPSANYVSPEMTGYEDLDDNGNWSYAGSYGMVWYPTSIPADWAPYRFGHWVWIAPWGWTWVDDAPWGFAPFHYGRWCQIGARWAWIPGPVAVRPVYAPALVAFVGGGGFHFSVSFGGGGGVAWFPLAPGEVFVPGYHVSRTYVNQVNVTNTVVNVTKVTNVYNTYTTTNVNTNFNRIAYANQKIAVTAVSHETFVNARPVAHNVVSISQREMETAPVGHLSGVEPIRGSVLGAGRPTAVAPPRSVVVRQVVADHTPVQPPVPFAQRQDKLLVRPAQPVRQMTSEPMRQTMPMRQTTPQPAQPAARPEPAPRPAPPVNRNEPVMSRPEQPAPRPEPENRPQPAPVERNMQQVPRPNVPPQPDRDQNRNNNERQSQEWSHPQARPVPPVQPKSENQARDEENKYRNWQQQNHPQPQERPQPQSKPQQQGDKPAPKPAPQKDNKPQK